jgi:hypothetical protein
MTTPAETLKSLEKGDLMETVPVLPGLSAEPLVFETTRKDPKPEGYDMMAFRLTFFGVELMALAAKVEGDKVTWASQ